MFGTNSEMGICYTGKAKLSRGQGGNVTAGKRRKLAHDGRDRSETTHEPSKP